MNHYSNNKRNSASRMCLKKMFLMFLVCGIFLQTMFPWLTVYGSDQSPSPQKLSAVPDGDVKDYNPGKDDYFAYLPVRYEKYGTAVTEKGIKYQEILLPVMITQNHVLVDVDFFQEITGVEVKRSPLPSGQQRARISVFQRNALLTEGKEELLYYLGNVNHYQRRLDQASFTLGIPPRVIGEDFYVPLMDLLAVLQISFDILKTDKKQMFADWSERFLQIDQPWKTVYDVLAEIKDDDSKYPFSYKDADLTAMQSSAELSTTVHGLLKGDADAWKSKIAEGSIIFKDQEQEIQDKKWCKELTKKILTTDERESRFLDEINARKGIQVTQFFMEGLVESRKQKATAQYLESLYDNLDRPWSKLRDYIIDSNLRDYEDVCADLADSEQYFKEIDKKLDKVSNKLLALQMTTDWIGTIYMYHKRDRIVSNGMRDMFSDAFQKKYNYTLKNLGKKNLDRMEKNISEIEKDVFMYSATETLIKYAPEIFEAVTKIQDPFIFAYQLVAEHVPVYGDILKAMDNFLLSRYAVPFQEDARLAAQGSLKNLRLGTSSKEEIMDSIELTYMYLKCCYVARDSAMKAFLSSEGKGKWRTENDTVAQSMAVLNDGYRIDRDDSKVILPPTASDLHKELSEKKTEEELFSLLIPMYVKVYGKVHQKTDKEKPVEDADCWITYSGENVGAFSGTEKGDFSVYIPLPIPREIKTDMSVLERRDITLGFSSPTIRGNATVELAVEPGEEADAGIVYLGGNIIQGIILDTDTGFPIPGVEVVIVDKTHPALSWTEYTDENGRYSFVDIPEGKYKMLLTKEDYEYGSLEFDADSASEICEMEDIYMDYISGLNVYYPPNKLKEFDGHSYLLVYETNNLWQDVTWRQAAAASRELGGHLVTITSESEQKFVGELYAGTADIHEYLGGFEAWIGAVKKDRDSSWRWVTGEDFSYSQEVEQDLPDADPKGLFYMEMKGPSMYFTSYEDPFNNWYASDGSEEDHPHFFIVEWDN